ncbi:MAG: hypothetical protein L7U72_13415 [Rubripirellula sp.]|nr:hypothetical protein [Rubripirellula sp.]
MHQILLRKPWSLHVDQGEDSIVVDVPDKREHSMRYRTAVYSRRFNATPAVMCASVDLVISDWLGDLVSVEVNAVPLAFTSRTKHGVIADLDDVLMKHNHIKIALVNSDGDWPRLTGSVSLQVGEPSQRNA